MKRDLLILLLILLCGTRGFSDPVELSKAQKAAEGFAQSTLTLMEKSDETRLVMATENYYVFNIGTDGFVIISNNDVFRPVIGYSNEGVFPVENPSPEMKYYLDNLSEGRQAALRASVQQSAEVAKEWSMLLSHGQLPSRNGNRSSFYLCHTKWDQGDPYNRFCPPNTGTRSYAGCVATAMSQVMYFWKYPTQGRGNHTYHHYQYGDLSADFGEAFYDFDKMPLSINTTSPDEEINAIAGFMYHCGIAVDMDYSPDGSGAYSADVPEAVMSYFGYSNRCRLRYRDDYSLEEFQAILKDQFDLGWPCYYSGTDTEGQGGHAFVCDGYDDNDMFHFNWGWSGKGNGYYVIDELNVSGYAFNSGQAVITNFVPSEVFSNTMKAPEFFEAVPNGDAAFSVTLSWVNPTTTLDGRPLDSIEKMVVMRDGVVVKTFENQKVGEAMTYVDVAGLPVTVKYSVFAELAGQGGRRAYSEYINLGPACPWTIKMRSATDEGWGSGALTVVNASGKELGSFKAEEMESVQTVEVPQGWVTFLWTAPDDSIQIGIDIMNADNQLVFSYDGPSDLMPTGIFYEIVNTCGGKGYDDHPSGLKARVEGDDVVLSWIGVGNPGYGYNIYRDGSLYTMVTDTTGYVDVGAALMLHSYDVTAFCTEGETDHSNTCCAVQETEGMCPRNLDLLVRDNGQMVLSWETPENTDGLSGYRIYRKAQGEEYKQVKALSASHTSYTLSGVTQEGTRYFYKVVGMYDHGHFESSPARSLQNPNLLYVEVNLTHIPSGLTLHEQHGIIDLQWEPAWRAETYSVYRNGELLAEGLTDLSYTDSIQPDGVYRIYFVTGVVNGIASSPSNKVYYGNSSIFEDPKDETRLYPNPSSGMVNIEAESLREVVVFDLSGQLLRRIPAANSVVRADFSDWDEGVYVVILVTAQGNRVRKLVLMK